DQSATLRLVDLDSAFVPGMDGMDPPEEAGHPAFRHPNRAQSHVWGLGMDLFPGLVVYTSLKALARRPELWAAHNNGDNLIFTGADFLAAGATPLWADLAGISDPEVSSLVGCLERCCASTWQPSGTFDTLIESSIEAPVVAVDFRSYAPPASAV